MSTPRRGLRRRMRRRRPRGSPESPAEKSGRVMGREQARTRKTVLENNTRTLLYLVNRGTVTLHSWFSRVQSLDTPDFVLFDLDPGGAEFEKVVKIARELRPLIAKRGVDPSIKTSG